MHKLLKCSLLGVMSRLVGATAAPMTLSSWAEGPLAGAQAAHLQLAWLTQLARCRVKVQVCLARCARKLLAVPTAAPQMLSLWLEGPLTST